MSNYHILIQDLSEKTISIIFRISIPDVNNNAGIPYRTALIDYLKHSRGVDMISSISPFSDAAELQQVQSGEIYEVQQSVRFSSLALTDAQKADELDARYNELTTESLSKLQILLEWWELKRTVT